MKKIAVIIADLFEDSEYKQPAKAFQDNGYELQHIGLKSGETVKGKKGEACLEKLKDISDQER